jgi:hypothetical protein
MGVVELLNKLDKAGDGFTPEDAQAVLVRSRAWLYHRGQAIGSSSFSSPGSPFPLQLVEDHLVAVARLARLVTGLADGADREREAEVSRALYKNLLRDIMTVLCRGKPCEWLLVRGEGIPA